VELFERLKARARAEMGKVANLCDLRFEELVQEPGGQELVALHADDVQAAITVTRAVDAQIRPSPALLIDLFSKDSLSMANGEQSPQKVLRQDHPEVQAILVYPAAIVEAKAEAQAVANNHEQKATILDEEVFVSQLQRRARILDDGFQAAVVRSVQDFAIPGTVVDWDADKQATAGEEFGCGRVILNAMPSATRQTSMSVTLVNLKSGGITDCNARSDQDTPANLTSWLKQGGDIYVGDHVKPIPRKSSGIPRKSSGIHKDLESTLDEQSSTGCWHRTSSSGHDGIVTLECKFRSGPGQVDVQRAPVKTAGRMLEKIKEYADTGAAWPLTGCILDPVRASVVCPGPADMVEVLSWFEGREEQTGLKVVRVKNKFGFKKDELVGSYRDLMVCVLYRAFDGLAIIGEIQIQDKILHNLKLKMHKLYKITRATSADQI